MADLYNDFPSWGENGEYPVSGFFYEGGDQVNEKHLDALWNGVEEHIDNLNDAIRDRVRDITGNAVLDQGLVASEGSGTREVDVSSSDDGAYVDGQRTGSVDSDTVSHSANGSSSTRTDVVWVDTDGDIGRTEDETEPSSGRMKLAEVDINTDDEIEDIRNYARDHVFAIASERRPESTRPGDFWQDLDEDREKVRQDGDWRTLVTDEDDLEIAVGDGLEGAATHDLAGGATFDLDFDESAIKDGGAKEIDASEFAGSNGSDGEVLFTNGSSTSWDTVPDTRTDVSDDESNVVNNTEDINFGNKLTVSDDGDSSVTVDNGISLDSEDGKISDPSGNGSETINFDNTYEEAVASIDAYDTDPYYNAIIYANWKEWTTDSDGNIDGMVVEYWQDGTPDGPNINWQVMGDKIQ